MRVFAAALLRCLTRPSISLAQNPVILSKHFLHGYPAGAPATGDPIEGATPDDLDDFEPLLPAEE